MSLWRRFSGGIAGIGGIGIGGIGISGISGSIAIIITTVVIIFNCIIGKVGEVEIFDILM